jgi:GTP-binding protein Era
MSTRCGYIALLGAPNAGKSTLLNRLVGQKLAIVTPKAQTTRNRITGAVIHDDAQLIFVDVPGVFTPHESKKFERAMVETAWRGAADADLIAVVIDASRGVRGEEEGLLERLPMLKVPTVLILNKIDLVDKAALLHLTAQLNERFSFTHTFMISALTGDGVVDIKAYAARHLPEGPHLFPDDYLTDLPSRLIASEITREQLFLRLREELPYALTVETEQWEERPDGSLHIHQIIVVEREGQKGIILGKGGVMLKSIGQSARVEIGRLWGVPVHLFLFIKVRSDWKSDPERFKYMGLDF